jgi:hypothetical protein
MTYLKPEPGRYRRNKDGQTVEVINCTGSEGTATVAVEGPSRTYYVQLAHFWRKYTLPEVDAAEAADLAGEPS